MIKNFFDKFYANPWGRLARRFVIAGGSAVIGYLMASGKLIITPEGIVDSVLSLNGADLLFSLKLFVGSGFLVTIDKMRREGTWSWFTAEEKAANLPVPAPVDKPVGEQ